MSLRQSNVGVTWTLLGFKPYWWENKQLKIASCLAMTAVLQPKAATKGTSID